MDASRRIPPLRRVAMMAALAALTLPAGPAEAAGRTPKAPVVTSVTPMQATVGDTLTLRGRHFRTGKGRNSIGFKRDGAGVVFVKSDISTRRMLTVKVPARLQGQLAGEPARFRLRVLAGRFGRAFTAARRSPTIAPRPAPPAAPDAPPAATPDAPVPPAATPAPEPVAPEPDCDADGTPNAADNDDDGDLLADDLENELGTDGCKADSDGDAVADGYEYRSAVDLNDDEYQQPNGTLAAPMELGYPNALLADAETDYDGDGLSLRLEYGLWLQTTPPAQRTLTGSGLAATPLNYSDGLQYSISRRCGPQDDGTPVNECNDLSDAAGTHDGRRVPALSAGDYDKYRDFRAWLADSGYGLVQLHDRAEWFDHAEGRFSYDIRDLDRSGTVEAAEVVTVDADANGWLSDAERDEDADGLSNHAELLGTMRPAYWSSCYTSEPAYPVGYGGTDPSRADTDRDGVRDGADDQDHDDVPNMMELSRMAASHLDDTDDGIQAPPAAPGEPQPVPTTGGGRICEPDAELDPADKWHPEAYGQVHPFNPCMPDRASRTCGRSFAFDSTPAPFKGPDWWSLQ